MARGLLAKMAECTGQHGTIPASLDGWGRRAAQRHPCIAGDGIGQQEEYWQLARDLVAEMAENIGHHNTITASLGMALA